MKNVLVAIAMLSAGAMTAPASATETAGTTDNANHLVDLIKPYESDTQAIRFMLSVAPMNIPAGLADCTIREAIPAMRSYYAVQLAENLSQTELQQAIKFFQSPAGQTVVALRLEHERNLLNAAGKGEKIADEQPHYPEPAQKELEAFGSTPAGKFFVGDEILAREAIRSHISDLRSEAMGKCLSASK